MELKQSVLFDVVKLEMYWKMIEIPDVCFVIKKVLYLLLFVKVECVR